MMTERGSSYLGSYSDSTMSPYRQTEGEVPYSPYGFSTGKADSIEIISDCITAADAAKNREAEASVLDLSTSLDQREPESGVAGGENLPPPLLEGIAIVEPEVTRRLRQRRRLNLGSLRGEVTKDGTAVADLQGLRHVIGSDAPEEHVQWAVQAMLRACRGRNRVRVAYGPRDRLAEFVGGVHDPTFKRMPSARDGAGIIRLRARVVRQSLQLRVEPVAAQPYIERVKRSAAGAATLRVRWNGRWRWVEEPIKNPSDATFRYESIERLTRRWRPSTVALAPGLIATDFLIPPAGQQRSQPRNVAISHCIRELRVSYRWQLVGRVMSGSLSGTP